MSKPKKKASRSRPLFVINEGCVRVGNEARFLAMVKSDPLGLSIMKWKFMARHAGKTEFLEDGHSSTCGLCESYGNCTECPVRGRTGRSDCEGTPYWKYVNSSTPAGRARAAELEVRFLESLREKR